MAIFKLSWITKKTKALQDLWRVFSKTTHYRGDLGEIWRNPKFRDCHLILGIKRNCFLIQQSASESPLNVFPSTKRWKHLENATITGHFGFVFEENSGREITTWLPWCHPSWKALFSKMFSVHTKTQAGVFKFLQFEEHFGKGLQETVRLTVEM